MDRAASSMFRWVSRAAIASSFFRPNFAPCPVIRVHLRSPAEKVPQHRRSIAIVDFFQNPLDCVSAPE